MNGHSEFDDQEIHLAIVNGEMFLEYMPIVSLAENGRCVGCEALVRWRKGDRIIMPMEFVPVIEDTPVSGILTYWVIDTVASELGRWLRETAGVHVGINVPPEVLGRGGLEYASRKSELLNVGKSILLEVTERGIPDRLGLDELRDLAGKGMLIGLDDVGLSGNNLLVLFQVPVDIIKLDKDVTSSIGADGSSQLLAEMAPLIHASGRIVVAEHVECAEQEAALRAAGVQLAQGWLYSRSLSVSDFLAWHAAHQ